MTQGERILWNELRHDKLGFRFKRQVPMLDYTLDFYCPAALLCIEVDGDAHDPEADAIRDAKLAERGVKTMRIPSLALFERDSRQGWLAVIYRACVERSGVDPFPAPPCPPPISQTR